MNKLKIVDNTQLNLFSLDTSGEVAQHPKHDGKIYCNICGNYLKAGFCHACCRKFPPDQMSADPRYCHDCYGFLSEEASFLPAGKGKPHWVPGNVKKGPAKTTRNGMGRTTIKIKAVKSCDTHPNGGCNKQTSVNGLSKKLPKRKIKNMAEKGMGSKRIAAELLKEGYKVNYRSIPNIIAS